jgi:hypothetical protein
MTGKKKADIEDACPFLPGVDLPRKNGLSTILSSILVVDWRVLAPALSLGLLLIVSGMLIPPLIPYTSAKEPSTWSSTPREYVTYYHQTSGWTPSYPNQIVHNGNLILNTGEEYVIENCTYVLQGTFLAPENSSLVIRNAEIWVRNTEQWDPNGPFPLLADMIFTNSSTLQIFNSSIVSDYIVDIVLLNDSTADIWHSNVTLTTLNGEDYSRIQVDNSTLGIICVATNASCYIRNSRVDYLAPGFQIWHSYYSSTSSYEIGPWISSRAEVVNSTINQLGVRMIDTSIGVKGPLAGEFSSWSPDKICSGGGWFNISVVDSNIGRIMLWADNSTVDISDNKDLNALVASGSSVTLRNVSIPVLYVDNCNTSVSGSVFHALQLLGATMASVRDTLTESIYLENFDGGLSCEQISALRLIGNSVNGTIRGSLHLQYDGPDLNIFFQSSRLEREYVVLAESGGFVVQGVDLVLKNGNTTLWSGSTIISGQASFNVTYCHLWKLGLGTWADDNVTSTLSLTASLGDEVQIRNVTVESSSPIIFSFETIKEPPIWGNRYTLLITGGLMIVATVVYVFLWRKPGGG